MGIVIAVGGPPHSGKSVFLNSLHDHLLGFVGDQVFKEPVCPDGEGKWSAEADPDIAAQLRRKYPFSEEFLRIKLQGISGLAKSKELLLLDLGGKRTDENRLLLEQADLLLIVSAQESEFSLWRQLGEEAGCRTFAQVTSELRKDASGRLDLSARSSVEFQTIEGAPFFVANLVNLDRDASDECYSDVLRQIAEWLVRIHGLQIRSVLR